MEPASNDERFHRALVLAPFRRDSQLTCELLGRAQIAAKQCEDVAHLCVEIEVGAGVAIIAQEFVNDAFIDCLRDVLERQPPWSDLPVVVLTKAHDQLEPIYDRLGLISNATFLERPVRMGTLLSAVRAGMRARKRQLEIRDFSRRKDEFLAMLGHELRNPLAAIQNAVHYILLEGLSPRAVRSSAIIERQLGHLSRIVDDVLDVARVTTGKVALERKRVELNQLVERWIQVYGDTEAVKAHRVVLEPLCEPIFIDGDPVRIEQILSNLMSNALKYTPPGGAITISLGREGDEAVLSVSDTGVGIHEEMLPCVFDLFTQAESTLARSRGGLGLGLALVRSLVEMHEGRVSAHSDGLGQGARFEVRLPTIEPPSKEDEGDATAELEGRPLRVVIVEDNEDGRETLRMILESSGHDVQVAADGKAGLELIMASDPDVAIVDIGLPEMDGYEVARLVREKSPNDCPDLIAMTGYGQPEDRRKALEAGFDAHLVKPIRPDDLHRLLALTSSRS